MNWRVVGALLKKDTVLFRSDRFYFFITVIGIIFYIAVYFLMPSRVNEKLKLAIFAPVLPPAFEQLAASEGIDAGFFHDVDGLKQAVLDGDYEVAVALPADIMDVWSAGGKPAVTIFYASAATPEITRAVGTLVEDLSYVQTGRALNFDTTEEILGRDMLGEQVAMRDRMRPLLVVFILLTEIMSLASLISVEIEQGTAAALLVTPMRVKELFAAKGILGLGLALGQAVLFMAFVGGFDHQPLVMLLTLLLGSLMAVGIGFLLASVTSGMMGITGWGMLLLIILAIPGFGGVIPGLLSHWARVIPSYYLSDTVIRVANYGAGWSEVWINLAVLAGFTVVVLLAGMAALGRRYR